MPSLTERYLDALVPSSRGPRGPRPRIGYSLRQRYWASLTGARLAPRSVQEATQGVNVSPSLSRKFVTPSLAPATVPAPATGVRRRPSNRRAGRARHDDLGRSNSSGSGSTVVVAGLGRSVSPNLATSSRATPGLSASPGPVTSSATSLAVLGIVQLSVAQGSGAEFLRLPIRTRPSFKSPSYREGGKLRTGEDHLRNARRGDHKILPPASGAGCGTTSALATSQIHSYRGPPPRLPLARHPPGHPSLPKAEATVAR